MIFTEEMKCVSVSTELDETAPVLGECTMVDREGGAGGIMGDAAGAIG